MFCALCSALCLKGMRTHRAPRAFLLTNSPQAHGLCLLRRDAQDGAAATLHASPRTLVEAADHGSLMQRLT